MQNLQFGVTGMDTEFSVWSCLRVYGGMEHEIARRLDRLGLQVFLPCKSKIRFYKKAKVEVNVPILRGLLPVCAPESMSYDLRRMQCVSELIRIEQQGDFREWLDFVPKLAGMREIEQDIFRPGREVTIVHGELAGLVGTITQRGEESRMQIRIPFMQGNCISFEVEESEVLIVE